MRGGNDEAVFTSKVDWETLRIGPETGVLADKDSDGEPKESAEDMPWN